MTSSIPFDEKRYKSISEILIRKEEHAGGKHKLPNAKVMVKGKVENLPIYNLRIDEVFFNKSNGRIKSEVLEKEASLGRELDELNQSDQAILRELLLTVSPDENEKLLADLDVNAQITPGIISCDGILINGNRRKAIMEKEWISNSKEKFRYIDVHVLPPDIKKDELWLIEAGIQLSSPQQLNYSPINNLLKIKEGIDAGLDIEVMAQRIYGMSKDKLKLDIERLDLINEYLEFFIEKPGRYYLVKNLSEHFINLQDIYAWAQSPRGRIQKDWSPEESDINELKTVGFFYIRGRFAHLRIRELRNLFANKASWLSLKKSLKLKTKLSEEELESLSQLPQIATDSPEENGFGEESTNTNPIERRDFAVESAWRTKNMEKLKNHFENAKEKFEIKKMVEKPLALANRALSNLKGIPQDKSKLNEPELDDVLQGIIEVTNVLRKIIKKRI